MGKTYSRLDYFYVSPNLTDILARYNTIYNSWTTSDHFPIWIQIQEVSEVVETDIVEKINFAAITAKQWSSWKEYLTQKANEIITQDISKPNTEENINILTDKWNNLIENAKKQFLINRPKRETNPFILELRENQELQKLKEEERNIRSDYNTQIGVNIKEIKKASIAVNKKKRELINQIQAKQFSKNEQKIRSNPQYIWKLIKKSSKKSQRNSDRPSLAMVDGNVSSHPEKVKINFTRPWEEIYRSKKPKQPIAEWLKNLKKQE